MNEEDGQSRGTGIGGEIYQSEVEGMGHGEGECNERSMHYILSRSFLLQACLQLCKLTQYQSVLPSF